MALAYQIDILQNTLYGPIYQNCANLFVPICWHNSSFILLPIHFIRSDFNTQEKGMNAPGLICMSLTGYWMKCLSRNFVNTGIRIAINWFDETNVEQSSS